MIFSSPECSNESIWRRHRIEIDVNKQKSPSDPRTSAKLSGAISRIEQEKADTAIREATKWTKSPKLKRQKRDIQEIAEVIERRSARFEAAVQRDQECKERQKIAQALKTKKNNAELQNTKRKNESVEETTDRQKKNAVREAERRGKETNVETTDRRKKNAERETKRRNKETKEEKADRLDKKACYQCKYVGKK